jgi:hypothetical protein
MVETKDDKMLISEEKDLAKLKLTNVNNALAIPVLEKQSCTPIAVLQVYNYDEKSFTVQ